MKIIALFLVALAAALPKRFDARSTEISSESSTPKYNRTDVINILRNTVQRAHHKYHHHRNHKNHSPALCYRRRQFRKRFYAVLFY